MHRSLNPTILVLAWLLAGIGCSPQMTRLSGRNPDLFEKETDHLQGVSRGPEGNSALEVYFKEKAVVIKDQRQPNESGSLYNPQDERNYLFTAAGPSLGRYIRVKVTLNRQNEKGGSAPKEKEAKAKDSKETAKGDDVEQELLKALPDLEPAQKGDPALIKAFKMRIEHRYSNGDVLATFTRKSTSHAQSGQVVLQARIPYEHLVSGEDVTTDDLTEVRLSEWTGGEQLERVSSGWEDEYALRLSGFTEAKSKAAQDLEDKRAKLKEAGDKLETRMKSFGEERRQMAKQREDLTKKAQQSDEKVHDLEEKVKDQAETIEKQEEKIKDLTPEDKPSDSKEGGHG